MAKKLWGGRFSKKTDPLVEEFTKSIDYDYKLARYDVISSIIHVLVLKNAGLISSTEAKRLHASLSKVKAQIEDGTFRFDKKCEDIHTNIQNAIEKDIKGLALKLHTARSRNDQVLFDLKMFCKYELLEVLELCLNARKTLLTVAEKAKKEKIIIPGYTHLQHAQLVYLSDHLLSYCKMMREDSKRLESIRQEIKISLGSGAFAGIPIPARVYKNAIKKFLEETKGLQKEFNLNKEVTMPVSMHTVSDRDFVIEILAAFSILGMHLSRFAEDIIIWSSKEFGFVEIDDAFATGSSLMPQKKNPDVLELIRGYTGTLYGNLVSVLTMMKGLPLTYNRDMQLDKPPLFSSFEIITKELKVLPGLVKTLKWNKLHIDKVIREEEALYATDIVYHLIEKGESFRKAHDIVGKLVKHSLKSGEKIRQMDKTMLKKFSDKLAPKDIAKIMDPERSVKSRISVDRSAKWKKGD